MNPEKRVDIYQPRYFPQLHYFNRALDADVFVILDSAQYTKALLHTEDGGKARHTSYQSDTPIKTSSGRQLLTVPVEHKLLPIKTMQIDYSHPEWADKHLKTLEQAYSRTPQFTNIFPSIAAILSSRYASLGDLNIRTIIWGMAILLGQTGDATTMSLEDLNDVLRTAGSYRLKKIITDEQTGVQRPDGSGKGTEWTALICQGLGASELYLGATAQNNYMDQDYYHNLGIGLRVQDWRCPEYPQQYQKFGFIPNLSIIDLLFNVHPTDAQKFILSS